MLRLYFSRNSKIGTGRSVCRVKSVAFLRHKSCLVGTPWIHGTAEVEKECNALKPHYSAPCGSMRIVGIY
jgi:hypothetical protein